MLSTTPTIHRSLAIRKQMQKAEFFTCWAIFFFTAVAAASKIANNEQTPLLPQAAAAPCASFIILYFRLSTLTRAVAYAIDLANAWVRFGGVIPMWLALHHSGVWVLHFTKVFFLTPHSPLQIMLFALASQTSHNTWAKKYSMTLYWGNVLVGILACWYLHRVVHEKGVFASRCFCGSLLVTIVGILLLVLDTVSKNLSKNLSKTYRLESD